MYQNGSKIQMFPFKPSNSVVFSPYLLHWSVAEKVIQEFWQEFLGCTGANETHTGWREGILEIANVKSEIKNYFYFLTLSKQKLNKQKQTKGNAAWLKAVSYSFSSFKNERFFFATNWRQNISSILDQGINNLKIY